MFPFLAPIQTANQVTRLKSNKHYVEITFLADSPFVSRAQSAISAVSSSGNLEASVPQLKNLEQLETMSNKSRSSEGLSKMGSRNTTAEKTVKKTSVSSLPTSARSEGKSSPVPVKETIPAPSRHKNKGLEMSTGMMDIFGGGGGGSSVSPQPARRDQNQQQQQVSSSSGNNIDSVYKNVENHDVAYDRAVRRARGGGNLSQPGPEWFDGFERMDMTDIELPPDPNCPAEKALHGEQSTPDFDSDWREAKEDVLAGFESLPGPDIGAGVEDEEEEEEGVQMGDEQPALSQYESKVASSEEEGEKNEKDDDDTSSSASSSKKGHPPSESRRNSMGSGETPTSRRESTSNGETPDEQTNAQQQQKDGKSTGAAGGGTMVMLVRNAQIINDDAIFLADILIEDGVIQNIGPNLTAPDGAEIIDASGKMVLPAGIDAYTQISESPIDDLITGSKSALAGGTGTIVEVVRPRGAEGLNAAVKRVKAQLEKTPCNVALSVVITDISDSVKSEMSQVVASEGVNSFVLDEVQSDDKLLELFEHASKLGAHIRCVPEKKSIIGMLEKKMLKLGVTGPEGYPQSHPESLESNQVDTLCVLGALANCPVSIVSLTSSESLAALEKARASSGALAHAEIASAAVAADGSALFSADLRLASAHLTDLPLRRGAQERLISALSTQPLVICTSGHKPVNTSSKVSKDFSSAPRGSTGAEERLAVVWEKAVRTGRIDAMRFVAVTSTNAAKVFNMYPKKGRVAVGADADLVIWDASAKRILEAKMAQSNQDVSIYEGHTVHSSVFATIIAGKLTFQNGKIAEDAAPVGFLPLSPNSPYLFSMVTQREKFGGNVEKVEREAAKSHQNGQNGQTPPPKTGEFDRNRKNVMESSIDFGGSSNRGRNPPGGRTTGFW